MIDNANIINTEGVIMTNRLATWGNIGTDVQGSTNVAEVLKAANLDYIVSKQQVKLSSGVTVPNRFATVRENDGHIYDIVSDRYSVVQNHEAFEFVDLIADKVKFEKAGETASGMVWIIASLPGVTILNDEFIPHVIFRNGFAGNTKITAAIVPLRVVCQNQFNHAFQRANNMVKVLHVGDVQQKMKEAQEVLQLQAEFMHDINRQAEKYATTKLTKKYIDRVMDDLFPIPEDANPYARHRMELQRDEFMAAYNHDDNSNFRGTAWGMINAYSDFATHLEPTGKSETKHENRFMKTVFNPITTPDVISKLVMVA